MHFIELHVLIGNCRITEELISIHLLVTSWRCVYTRECLNFQEIMHQVVSLIHKGRVGHGIAWHGMAWHGMAWQGRAGQGRAGQGRAWRCVYTRECLNFQEIMHQVVSLIHKGRVGHGIAWHGMAWHGMARQGRAGQGRAGQGRAGQGRA